MIIDRYIGKTVTVQTLIVMCVLLALFSFTVFVGELGDVGKGDYGLWEAAQFVVASLPRLAYQLFPSVALLGSIIGLGILASNSELLVMRASGVSLQRIAAAVMKVGLLLMIIATLLGEVVAPTTERYAQNLRSAALTKNVALQSESGMWARDGEHFVHIRDVYADGSLGQISIYELDGQHALKTVIRAQQAVYHDDKWLLKGVSQSTISEDEVVTDKLSNQTWSSLLNPQLLGVVAVSPEFLSARGLHQYIRYLRDNDLSSQRYEQAFWKKLIFPLATGVMVYLAIPFVFGPLRSVAIGPRILVGTLVGIGFYVVDQLVSFVGLVYHFNPIITVVAPTAVFFVAAVYLTRRVL